MFDVTGTFTLSQGPIALTNDTSATTLQEVIDAPGKTISGARRLWRVHRGERRERNPGRHLEQAPVDHGGDAANDGGGIDNSGTLALY